MPGYTTDEDRNRTAEESHADHEDHAAELARLDGAHAKKDDEGDKPA